MRFFRLIGLAPCSPLRPAPCIPPGPFSKLAHVEADPSVSSSPRGGRTRWEVSWAAQVPRWPGFQTHTELSPTSHTTPRGGRCWVRDEGEASQPEECSLPGASLTHGPATRSLLWGKGNEMDAGEEAASGSRLLPRACALSTLALAFLAFSFWGFLALLLNLGTRPGRPAPL